VISGGSGANSKSPRIFECNETEFKLTLGMRRPADSPVATGLLAEGPSISCSISGHFGHDVLVSVRPGWGAMTELASTRAAGPPYRPFELPVYLQRRLEPHRREPASGLMSHDWLTTAPLAILGALGRPKPAKVSIRHKQGAR
jgi:hypothetical protein